MRFTTCVRNIAVCAQEHFTVVVYSQMIMLFLFRFYTAVNFYGIRVLKVTCFRSEVFSLLLSAFWH